MNRKELDKEIIGRVKTTLAVETTTDDVKLLEAVIYDLTRMKELWIKNKQRKG